MCISKEIDVRLKATFTLERLRAPTRQFKFSFSGRVPISHLMLVHHGHLTLELSTWDLPLFILFMVLRWHLDGSHVESLRQALHECYLMAAAWEC
jgi:hypothetical protein